MPFNGSLPASLGGNGGVVTEPSYNATQPTYSFTSVTNGTGFYTGNNNVLYVMQSSVASGLNTGVQFSFDGGVTWSANRSLYNFAVLSTSGNAVGTSSASVGAFYLPVIPNTQVRFVTTGAYVSGTTAGFATLSTNGFYLPTVPQLTQGVSQANPPLAAIPLGATAVSGTTGSTPITTTGSTAILASGGGSTHNYITALSITNGSATVGTLVHIEDGATIIWTGYLAAINGSVNLAFNPPLRQPTAATAINAVCGTTGSSITVSINGYVL